MNRILWKHATMKKWLQYFLVFLLAFTLSGCGASPESAEKTGNTASSGKTLDAARSEDEENPKIDESSQESDDIPHQTTSDEDSELQEDGVYTSRDEVAQYIFTYGHLPSNFITKKRPKPWDGKAGAWNPTRRANASAEAVSAITKDCCRRRKDVFIRSATSTRWGLTGAAPNGSFFQTTD